MEYYKLLQLKREPFSNSPDPEYFFLSRRHQECLQKLELALRLKRGLNVIMGEVGTGKTTLCRELIRKFSAEADIETHLILDPSFGSSEEFLRLLYALFHDQDADPGVSALALKDHIQHALFAKGVDQQRTVVLIIDEGQKISPPCVEILRELLNFETNQFKLLQIVIFAQLEFERILENHANFADRINLLHHLAPMDFKDTRRMIHHRLKLSSATAKPRELFTLPALWAIYRATHGYPRKIIHLCHQSVLTLLIQNRTRAGWKLIRTCKQRLIQKQRPWRHRLLAGAVFTAALLLMVAFLPQYLAHESERAAVSSIFKIQMQPAPEQVAEGQPQPARDAPLQITPLPTISPPPAATYIGESHSSPSSDGSAATSALPASTHTPETRSEPIAASEPTPAEWPTIEPPLVLGELPVRPGDTLTQLARLVYGADENRCLRSVMAANPNIQNPDAIDIQDIVTFPLVVFQWDDRQLRQHRIVLDEVGTLSAARDKLMDASLMTRVPVRLFCYWAPGIGSRFQLSLAMLFDSQGDAQGALTALPTPLASKAEIQSGWPGGALLFSNPNMDVPKDFRNHE